jgi:GYF domain 2
MRSKREAGLLWYYRHSDLEHGPLNDAAIQELLARGVVAESTLVGSDGTVTWLALKDSALGNLIRPVRSPKVSNTARVVAICAAVGILSLAYLGWRESPAN